MPRFKRQNVLVNVTPDDVAAGVAPGSKEPIIMSLANAPGLPPVCAVVLVSSDEDGAVVRAPEGFELIQVHAQICVGQDLGGGQCVTVMCSWLLLLLLLLLCFWLGS